MFHGFNIEQLVAEDLFDVSGGFGLDVLEVLFGVLDVGVDLGFVFGFELFDGVVEGDDSLGFLLDFGAE